MTCGTLRCRGRLRIDGVIREFVLDNQCYALASRSWRRSRLMVSRCFSSRVSFWPSFQIAVRLSFVGIHPASPFTSWPHSHFPPPGLNDEYPQSHSFTLVDPHFLHGLSLIDVRGITRRWCQAADLAFGLIHCAQPPLAQLGRSATALVCMGAITA